MTGAVLFIPEIANGAEVTVILNLGLASMNIIGLLVAAFIGAGLMNKEVDKRTMYLLVAKPISRTELICGKQLGLTALLSTMFAIMLAVYLGLGTVLSSTIPYASLSLAVVFMFLELSLIVAISLLFGVITSSILATILTLAMYVMGHLSPVLLQFADSIESMGLSRVLKGLFLVLPNLARLNLKNDAIYSQLPSTGELGLSALYCAAYIVALLTIASMVFSRRQF